MILELAISIYFVGLSCEPPSVLAVISDPANAIQHLETQFCHLSSSLFKELSTKNVTVQEVIPCMLSFPYYLKRELLKTVEDNLETLKKSREIDGLQLSLDKLWNFIDYDLLDHIIIQLGSAQLKSQMSAYVTRLVNFKKSTTVSCLIKSWRGCREYPLQCQEVTAKLDVDPNSCTLDRLNSVRQSLSDYFLPPLSQFVMLYRKFLGGSVIVVWALPDKFCHQLIRGVKSVEGFRILKQLHILSLHIGTIPVYPATDITSRELPLSCKLLASFW